MYDRTGKKSTDLKTDLKEDRIAKTKTNLKTVPKANMRTSPKTNPKIASLFEVIHVLSDVNRIQILTLLAKHEELCARDILSNFAITQPTLSHHMNTLLENHLVVARKSGRWVYYRVSGIGLQGVIDFFESLKSSSGTSSAKQQVKSPTSSPKKSLSPKAGPRPPVIVAEEPVLIATPNEIHIKNEKKKDKSKSKLNKKDKKKKKNKKD